MKIELNIKKTHLYALITVIVVFIGIISVVAYTSNDPRLNGHTITEIEGLDARISEIRTELTNTLNTELSTFIACPAGLNAFFEWDKSGLYDIYGTPVRTFATDTCDTDATNEYTCPVDKTAPECIDAYYGTGIGIQYYKRSVTCTAVKTLVCKG
ncbi:MAG: hypothetical protein U9R08_04240 [Nanoarchaeota archaeon]|nr:hypothetical protein [Nanoarchaeota archaeon]